LRGGWFMNWQKTHFNVDYLEGEATFIHNLGYKVKELLLCYPTAVSSMH
jgi:hypothetical protein